MVMNEFVADFPRLSKAMFSEKKAFCAGMRCPWDGRWKCPSGNKTGQDEVDVQTSKIWARRASFQVCTWPSLFG